LVRELVMNSQDQQYKAPARVSKTEFTLLGHTVVLPYSGPLEVTGYLKKLSGENLFFVSTQFKTRFCVLDLQKL
jgi:hypothetical protein